MSKLRSDHMMVVAIDFGTTYSGYAFSLGSEFDSNPTQISSNTPWIASQGLVSHKTPTTVLLNPDATFYKFGYEAEDKYQELAQDETVDHKQYYYFRRFKMVLHSSKNLRREMMLVDENGKSMSAINVFGISIRYLVNHALATINNQGKLIDLVDIHWVLTVPAIWSDGAKQFMREAALQADIETNSLSIALEPEAASVYCKFLPGNQLTGQGSVKSMFELGNKYMILDLGGGTVDITVHRVEKDNKLCEIHAPSGGAWGGTKVDEYFINFLKELLGDDVVHAFMKNHTDDAIELLREFEIKKRKIKLTMADTDVTVIKLPMSMFETYQKITQVALSDTSIQERSKHGGAVKVFKDKLKIDNKIMQSFFKYTLVELVEHIQEVLAEETVRGTDTFIMVGGYSESGIVQETVKAKFPNMKVIIPFDAGLAVLKGAVIFGHAPLVVTSRICRRTYGMAVSKVYVKGMYPEDKAEYVNGREIVRNVFHKIIQMGELVKVGQAVSTVPLSAQQGQTFARVRVFSSKEKDPKFVTDRSTEFLGDIEVNWGEGSDYGGLQTVTGSVVVQMVFGGTELMVEAKEQTTGKSCRSRFDFLDK